MLVEELNIKMALVLKGLLKDEKSEKVLKCEIRNSYVDAAYESMSLGEAGGFDFN
ncbi:hypothetical protein KVE88_07430 [Helicobacter pylori]|nr:hypothetical protein KVE88_07430 [Helicobacter pylori]